MDFEVFTCILVVQKFEYYDYCTTDCVNNGL